MKAIVLAGGRSKRMGEGIGQKVMIPVNEKPMLFHVLDSLGFIPQKDITIVVGYKDYEVTRAVFGAYQIIRQDDQLGTGNAAMVGAQSIKADDSDVLICYGDMPLISRETYEGLMKRHASAGADVTLLTVQAPNSGLHHGRIIRENGEFKTIVEYSDATDEEKKINELNAGVYVFKLKALTEVLKKLDNQNASNEYLLTDAPLMLLGDKKRVATFTIYNSNEIYGVNTPEELILVEEIASHIEQRFSENSKAKWFGTGGWRAIIGDDFIKSNIQKLSQAIADDMKAKSKELIVIGFDRRFLSDKAAQWASEVFAGNGITVIYIGRIAPTPLVMFTVKKLAAYYGMAITASHNPADYNGIKVFTEGGKDADESVTKVFEDIINRGVTPQVIPFADGLSKGIIQVSDPNNDYIDSIISQIDMDAIRRGNLRILLDPMFGVSKTSLQTILMTARCDTDLINESHDTLFGGRLPAPTEETLKGLQEKVVHEHYDLGLATDGDADRIGVIDANGKYIHANEILAALYHYLLKYKGIQGDCVRNIATTNLLDKIAKDFGQTCYEVPVGFKNISAKMEETNAIIGGESSGGLTIRGHIKGKDGIFACALIVEMICSTKKSISLYLKEIYAKYGQSYIMEFDTRFTLEKKQILQDLLFKEKALPDWGKKTERVSYLDGCKVYFEDGAWIIIRFSGTEPLLRIMCEANSAEDAKDLVEKAKEFLDL